MLNYFSIKLFSLYAQFCEMKNYLLDVSHHDVTWKCYDKDVIWMVTEMLVTTDCVIGKVALTYGALTEAGGRMEVHSGDRFEVRVRSRR